MVDIDSYFGIHAKALLIREQRASQIAHNLSNVNTPNYKAKDIDFGEALDNAMQKSSAYMVTDDSKHINPSEHLSTQLKYRLTGQRTLDGNTVDKNLESVEFTKNALAYQASLSFLNGKIKTMLTALRGE